MPVLSLPLPTVPMISDLLPRMCLPPIRIPFPVLRIGSILPCSLNGPLKESLLALFKLAWSNKIQLPVLITVCFLALDVRLQLEINIFWEPPRNGNRRERERERGGDRDRIANGPRYVDGAAHAHHAIHGAALVAATLVHRERQRLRLTEERDRQLGLRRQAEDRLSSINRSDDDDEYEDETDTDATLEWCENPEAAAAAERRKKMRKKQKSKKTTNKVKKVKTGHSATDPTLTTTTTMVPSTQLNKETEDADDESENTDDEEEEEEEDSDTTDDMSSDDDSDDDDNGRGSGSGSHPRGSGGYDDDHDDFFGDRNHGSGGDDDDSDDSSGGSPLVVELEIRQRPETAVFNLVKNNFSRSVLKTGICGSQLFKYQILPAVTITQSPN